jgi:hypothetical protein
MNGFDNFVLKNSKLIIFFCGFLFIALFITFLGVVNNKTKSSNSSLIISPAEVKVLSATSKAQIELTIGKRIPNTTEVIDIIANRQTPNDNIAIIRYRIEGGEVVDVKSTFTLMEGCNGMIDSKTICVDIAKTTPFTQGEIIASITIKWQDVLTPKIFSSTESGFYNGSEFNSSN